MHAIHEAYIRDYLDYAIALFLFEYETVKCGSSDVDE